jgi:hypothetical protein
MQRLVALLVLTLGLASGCSEVDPPTGPAGDFNTMAGRERCPC